MTARHMPVLVGAGTAMRREEDYTKALEPLDLMIEAVSKAGADCGNPALLADVGRIAVPRGRWRYRNPSGAIAAAIGAAHAQTLLSTVGVLQQSLIASACEDIANGTIDSAIIAGADAGYRILRARISGNRAPEREQDDDPDVLLQPADELRHEAEAAAGLQMPVGLYALAESARRAQSGRSIDEHRAHLARVYARFSEIAAQNPDAWNREAKSAPEIMEAGRHNPMQAFPYTRFHCSTWNVDQAAALLLCSEAKADALGIAEAQRIYPVASAESGHMMPLSARADIAQCIGAQLAAEALYRHTQIAPDEIDLVELYSCFPIAVECFAEAARIPADRDLTITGGMAFAGGPYNNYFFQATAKAAQLLKADLGVEVAFADVGGWDTHVNQGGATGQLANRFRDFADSIAALVTDLGDRMGDVTILTVSEFGRMARQNGNGGTDHGHAGAMLAIGGNVRGGRVHGRWPGLAREQLFEGRDLALTTDFRSVFSELVTGHLGAARTDALFPGFDGPPGIGLLG